ncbi:MAG: hypothetical protein HY711_04795, partial [Candidatus Melainabacteria bacterium]|nr:hypothetical protein [Candidatus Melainabacteria bacterium]
MGIHIGDNGADCPCKSRVWKRIVACLATVFLLCSQMTVAALADHLPENMDLSSTTASIEAPVAGTITQDGQARDISQGMLLTPAEYVALQQVAAGQQSIELSALGAAMGGVFDLCVADHCADISNFVLPQGVTAMGGAQLANSTLSIDGLVNIQGNLLLQSVLSSVTVGDLLVSQTGRISSQVVDPANTLSIVSASNIVNNGLISSIGNLNLTVGQALTNTGTIESLAGSVSITGLSDNFIIQNTGTITALNGAVNLATALPQANMSLLGGIVQAQNINFLVPQGSLNIIAEQLNGLVGITAKDLALKIAGDLNVGSLDLSGDPVFEVASYNGTGFTAPGQLVRINSTTSINVTSPISTASSVGDGGDVTLQAGTTVTTQAIDTSSTAEEGEGGQITIVAGGAVSTGSLNSSGTGVSGEASNIVVASNGSVTTGTITANGAVGTEGIVVTAAGSITTGDVSATVNSTNRGGFVDLIGRTGVTAGVINVNSSAGPGGGIYVSANGNINLGNLSANGVGAPGGDILLTTAVVGGTGTITRGTTSVTGAPAGSVQEFTPGAPPPGLQDVAFANGGALTLFPRQLPGGGFTSFSNTGTITLSTDPVGAGFDTVGAFFVNAAGDFGILSATVSTNSQRFIGIAGGTATAGTISNSASGVFGVAGDIIMTSYTGNVVFTPTGAYDTGSDDIILINAGAAATSTFGSNPGTTSLTFGNDGVLDHFGGGRLLVRSGVGGINMTNVMNGSDFM